LQNHHPRRCGDSPLFRLIQKKLNSLKLDFIDTCGFREPNRLPMPQRIALKKN